MTRASTGEYRVYRWCRCCNYCLPNARSAFCPEHRAQYLRAARRRVRPSLPRTARVDPQLLTDIFDAAMAHLRSSTAWRAEGRSPTREERAIEGRLLALIIEGLPPYLCGLGSTKATDAQDGP